MSLEDLATVSKVECSMRNRICDIPDRGGVFLQFLPIEGSTLEVSSANFSSRSGGNSDRGSWRSEVSTFRLYNNSSSLIAVHVSELVIGGRKGSQC